MHRAWEFFLGVIDNLERLDILDTLDFLDKLDFLDFLERLDTIENLKDQIIIFEFKISFRVLDDGSW